MNGLIDRDLIIRLSEQVKSLCKKFESVENKMDSMEEKVTEGFEKQHDICFDRTKCVEKDIGKKVSWTHFITIGACAVSAIIVLYVALFTIHSRDITSIRNTISKPTIEKFITEPPG